MRARLAGITSRHAGTSDARIFASSSMVGGASERSGYRAKPVKRCDGGSRSQAVEQARGHATEELQIGLVARHALKRIESALEV